MVSITPLSLNRLMRMPINQVTITSVLCINSSSTQQLCKLLTFRIALQPIEDQSRPDQRMVSWLTSEPSSSTNSIRLTWSIFTRDTERTIRAHASDSLSIQWMTRQVSSKLVCSSEIWQVLAWTWKQSWKIDSWKNAFQESSLCSFPKQICLRSSKTPLQQPMWLSRIVSLLSRPSKTLKLTWRLRWTKQESQLLS